MANKSPRVCKFCGELRILCRSHVIPEFAYGGLYENDGRLRLISRTGSENELRQKGVWEWLLCSACETLMSGAESYVARIISGRKKVDHSRVGDLICLHQVDFKKVRALQLGTLLRSDSASHSLFRQVTLREIDKENIKSEIFEGKGPSTIICLNTINVLDNEVVDPIVECVKNETEYGRTIQMNFGGLSWNYFLDVSFNDDRFSSFHIDQRGNWPLLITDIRKNEPLMDLMIDLATRCQH